MQTLRPGQRLAAGSQVSEEDTVTIALETDCGNAPVYASVTLHGVQAYDFASVLQASSSKAGTFRGRVKASELASKVWACT